MISRYLDIHYAVGWQTAERNHKPMARRSHTMRWLPVSIVSLYNYRSVGPLATPEQQRYGAFVTTKRNIGNILPVLNRNVAVCGSRDVFARYESAESNVQLRRLM